MSSGQFFGGLGTHRGEAVLRLPVQAPALGRSPIVQHQGHEQGQDVERPLIGV